MNSDRLRVAQVICTDSFAGAERYVVSLTRGLRELLVDVEVIGGCSDRMPAELSGSGAKWRPGPTVGQAARALVSTRPFDVVHLHMTAAETAGVLAAPVVRAPLVASRHFAQPRGSTRAARAAGAVIRSRVAEQLAISRFVADRIDGRSVVVPPGTTPSDRDGPGADQRSPVVLVLQRLEVEKRTDLALQVWAASGLAAQGWQLCVAGDGEQSESLRGLARALRVEDSVTFCGAVTDTDRLLTSASILLASRPDEPFGLSVVEAMAHALPVFAAAGGGHDETVGRVSTRYLFDPADAQGAGAALAALAGDVDERDSYGRALQEEQRRSFSAGVQAERTLEIYRRVIGRPR